MSTQPQPDVTTSPGSSTYHIVLIESFQGEDTYLECGDDELTRNYLYCIVEVGPDGIAGIADNAYRSVDEAARAWPHAVRPAEYDPGRRPMTEEEVRARQFTIAAKVFGEEASATTCHPKASDAVEWS